MGCVAKGFFLDYRHLVEYILYVQSIPPTQRDPLMQLWYRTRHYRWGPVFRLIKAAKAMGVHVEDPFVLVFNGSAFSTDGHLPFLKHSIRNSYRQLLYNVQYIGESIAQDQLLRLISLSPVNMFFL